jgi:outer membrane protein assembly factor BamB
VPTRLLFDPGRRIQTARPVFGEGILVCPTNAGVVLGVDPLTPSLVWAYPYRTAPLTQAPPYQGRRGRPAPPRITSEWKAPVTMIQNGKVMFTAPDDSCIHCLNLRDGALLWKAPRNTDDLFVAGVIASRVLVVGKQMCRALDLADGSQLWQRDMGLPAGQGVASGNLYFLPLKETTREKEPGVYAFDVRTGVVLTRTLWPQQDLPTDLLFWHGDIFRKDLPGNLTLWRGGFFSQTTTAVTAYPDLKERQPADSR